MKTIDKFSKEYRKKLVQTKVDFEKFLTRHTGYYVSLEVVKDKSSNYCYRARISLDSEFNEFASYILKSPQSKKKLGEELKQHILSLDLRNRKNGQSIVVAKQTNSTSLLLECAECQQTKGVLNYHRHLKNTDMFKNRCGYSWLCKDCANDYFIKVTNKSSVYHGLYAICAIYDRPFNKAFADIIINAADVPGEIANLYFRRLNLSKLKDGSFSDSDMGLFEKAEIN